MLVKVERFESLEAAQSYALRAVDEAAEQTRGRYLSSGSGQAMEYEEAHRQAVAFQSDPSVAYPMLEADVEAGLAPTVAEAAALVMQRRGEWEVLGKLIRSTRLKAKREIREVTTQREVAQIREQARDFLATL